MTDLNEFVTASFQYCLIAAMFLVIFAVWLARGLGNVTHQLGCKKIKSRHTGIETARDLFALANIRHVRVVETKNAISDYYDTQENAIYLSEETAERPTITATGIVAHEVGHAIQKKKHFWLIQKAENVIRVNQFTGNVTLPAFIAGFLLELEEAIVVGWLSFLASIVCNILLFWLNSDASARGERLLKRDKFVSKDEGRLVEKFLWFANLSYLGGIITTPFGIFSTLGYAFDKLAHKPLRR